MASALARGGAHRVLLVDADPLHPDLDLRLGAADWDGDRCPSARLDRVLLQLPELSDQRVSIDSLLWVAPNAGVRALLAPARSEEIGREHLDYLYTYVLAPAFDAVVVDGGPLVEASGAAAGLTGFWLGLASSVLVPCRPTASGARAAIESLELLQRLGVAESGCRLILGADRAESRSAARLQRRLVDFEVLRWPWSTELARRAAARQRPLGELDRRFADAIAGLVAGASARAGIGP
ncbi:MAG: hypothetical protein ACREN1_05005 [Candidatus Dormibacteria bacterium]